MGRTQKRWERFRCFSLDAHYKSMQVLPPHHHIATKPFPDSVYVMIRHGWVIVERIECASRTTMTLNFPIAYRATLCPFSSRNILDAVVWQGPEFKTCVDTSTKLSSSWQTAYHHVFLYTSLSNKGNGIPNISEDSYARKMRRTALLPIGTVYMLENP